MSSRRGSQRTSLQVRIRPRASTFVPHCVFSRRTDWGFYLILGPWGFPILGHLPLLGLEPHVTAMKWKRKYGPVLGIDFASFPCVIISDHRLAKEAFALESFAGRPALPYFNDRSGGPAYGHVEGIV